MLFRRQWLKPQDIVPVKKELLKVYNLYVVEKIKQPGRGAKPKLKSVLPIVCNPDPLKISRHVELSSEFNIYDIDLPLQPNSLCI